MKKIMYAILAVPLVAALVAGVALVSTLFGAPVDHEKIINVF
jgi:hypothetical protein